MRMPNQKAYAREKTLLKAPATNALHPLYHISQHARWQRQQSQEDFGQSEKSEVSSLGTMGKEKMQAKIIEFKLPLKTAEAMWLTGETLLELTESKPGTLFDLDGTPVLIGELYKCTSDGIRRVA
jgi:hypothetical protein